MDDDELLVWFYDGPKLRGKLGIVTSPDSPLRIPDHRILVLDGPQLKPSFVFYSH
ncbi:hypothetical protein Scep_019151 [Stephania cephalantha]|uniref:Uncharacterized protein n=1 Tax=Stephania cephalantha TaxID=152367 RepID=A0AAP0IAT2_9MAGN